jgi:hypothetical protein
MTTPPPSDTPPSPIDLAKRRVVELLHDHVTPEALHGALARVDALYAEHPGLVALELVPDVWGGARVVPLFTPDEVLAAAARHEERLRAAMIGAGLTFEEPASGSRVLGKLHERVAYGTAYSASASAPAPASPTATETDDR